MTETADATTRLILTVFRLNGALLAAGDDLVRDLGLTSARWQVLGALADLAGKGTVSQTARRMGLARQSVQRVANELEAAGLVAFIDNPDHARAKLVALTPKGEVVVAAALARQRPWADALGRGLADEIDRAARTLETMTARLAASNQETSE